jgi:Family of unknown function (DUF6111)
MNAWEGLMVRVVIENVLLFLAPAALYLAYELMIKKNGTNPRQILDESPLVGLFVAGLLCVIGALILFRSQDEGTAGQAYEPPTYKDGKIIPGRVR